MPNGAEFSSHFLKGWTCSVLKYYGSILVTRKGIKLVSHIGKEATFNLQNFDSKIHLSKFFKTMYRVWHLNHYNSRNMLLLQNPQFLLNHNET